MYLHRRPARLLGYAVVLVASLVPLIFSLGLLVLMTGGGALGIAPLILFSSIPVILHGVEHRARTRFLAERCRTGLPRARVIR